MKEFLDNLRAATGENVQESEPILTLSKEDFITKMLKEKDGTALLDCLEMGEWRIAERMGLIDGYYEDGKAFFTVPRWNNLVAHLRIVNSV